MTDQRNRQHARLNIARRFTSDQPNAMIGANIGEPH
jgi:hypothetical protein